MCPEDLRTGTRSDADLMQNDADCICIALMQISASLLSRCRKVTKTSEICIVQSASYSASRCIEIDADAMQIVIIAMHGFESHGGHFFWGKKIESGEKKLNRRRVFIQYYT